MMRFSGSFGKWGSEEGAGRKDCEGGRKEGPEGRIVKGKGRRGREGKG